MILVKCNICQRNRCKYKKFKMFDEPFHPFGWELPPSKDYFAIKFGLFVFSVPILLLLIGVVG